MEQVTETIYQFNADAYLKSIDPELHFYERIEKFIDGGHSEMVWEKISVGKVWITTGPKNCQIHADIDSLGLEDVLTKEITPVQYRKFLNYKGDKRRLNMFLDLWKGQVWMRREKATKHVDIRVTPDLYNELEEAAKTCSKNLSNYCRDILKGKVPKAALSDEEKKLVNELVAIRNDIVHFRNALTGHLAGMPKQQRLSILIEGKSLSWYRENIVRSLAILNRFVDNIK